MNFRVTKLPKAHPKLFLVTEAGSKKEVAFGEKANPNLITGLSKDLNVQRNLRHMHTEAWDRAGLYTRGFWERWFLHESADLETAIDTIKSKFRIHVTVSDGVKSYFEPK